MKKLNYFLLAAAGLALASCSQDEVAPGIADGDGNFSVTIKLPEDLRSRAVDQFGQGYVADQLNFAVYDATTGTLMQEGMATFPAGSLETTVAFNLVRGKSYNIAFFAQSEASMNSAAPGAASNAVYEFNAEEKTVTVNYKNMTSDNNLSDAYDCFYNVLPTGQIGSSTVNASIILNRPVGQVNWGTDDLFYKDGLGETQDMVAAHDEAYGSKGQYIQTNLKVTKPYNTLNLLTGEATPVYDDSDTGEVIIKAMAAPYTLTFPVDAEGVDPTDYVYVAMTYLMAPSKESTLYDLNLNIDNLLNPAVTTEPSANSEVEVSAAPVQANYQTNIYGNLLSDNVIVTVKKNPVWEKPSYNIPLTWDGNSVTIPELPTDKTQPVVINDAATLAGLAARVNGTNGQTAQDLEGYTFQLGADLDMGGNSLSIGSATRNGGSITDNTKSFSGVFDGNGYTISNLKIEGTSNADDAVGIFPSLDGANAEVKNLTVSSITINAPENEQAAVIGLVSGGAKVTNVTVTSGLISSKEGAAGIVGRVLGTGTVTNCENSANISTTVGSSGGIVGTAYRTVSPGITVSGCTNNGNVTSTTTEANASIGGIVGVSGANVIGCKNYGNVSADVSTVGGIVAYQNSCGSVKNCENNGTISGNSYVGGIVGWVGAITYDLQEVIEISGNTNKGTLIAKSSAGGIMTINRWTVNFSNNTNNAPSITSGGNAAGLICGDTTVNANKPTGGNGYINYGDGNANETPADQIVGTKTNETFLGIVWMVSENKAVTQN